MLTRYIVLEVSVYTRAWHGLNFQPSNMQYIYIYIHVSGAYATSNFVEGICFQSQVTYVFEEQCQCAIGHTKLMVHFLLPLWSTHDVKDIIGNI
mgnify:CR=1 FL=1